MALLLLSISKGEISASADCDLQTGGLGVVVQSELQLSRDTDVFVERTICADAADAALRKERNA